MESLEEEYTADDILIKFICSEIIFDFDLSDDFHPPLCRWAAEVLNSYDVKNDVTRMLLTSKLKRAHELLTSQYH